MFYFIVSGYIPGTDVQLTFDMIALFAASFMAALVLFLLVRSTLKDTKKVLETIQPLEEISL